MRWRRGITAICRRPDGNVIAYNDRPTSSTGAPFETSVRFCQPDGTNVPYTVITNNPLPAGVWHHIGVNFGASLR